MSYQALYRVWRPQRFEDVAGQTAITQTLRNALAQQKMSHAYLFTGPRGTGKTSAAKIFAKAINCPNGRDGEPCNECEICQAITTGQLNDVIEIDAASNNGVEEIRDIREKANYAPTSADYKVYIIDEVHMLSTGAFNALLKTLEEPPKNVVFILATTEPHKIPLTIISRTQRFDFKRIPTQEMIDRMTFILDEENVAYDEEALTIIARAAEGGMRDALSILDQTISFADEQITVDDAVRITGSLTQQLLLGYFEAVQQKDTEQGLALLQSMLAEGKDAGRFTEDVILFSRDLLVYQKAPGSDQLLQRAKADEPFKQLSQSIDSALLYEVIRVFNETQRELRLSNHAEVYLEVATVRLTQAAPQASANAAVAPVTPQAAPADGNEVNRLQNELAEMKAMIQQLQQNGAAAPAAAKPKRAQVRRSTGIEFKPNKPAIHKVLEQATKKDLAQLRDVWPDLMDVLTVTQRAVMKASKPVAASPTGLIVSFEYDILCQKATDDQDLIENIGNHLERFTGHRAQLVCVPQEQWTAIRQEFIDQMRMKGSASQSQDGQPEMEGNGQSQAEQPVEPAPPKEDKVVTEALQLFGEEVVVVQDD
ncbi:DNA polymerase III subunit gamma/tau [Atopococcus tabaci]|uniref:DNA polymerase III subunit gamma/tau n=1 Tax=Atopococcus tabaci TaxID=269774 RepID=UPI00040CA88C|nr:DNA polymerase III subunit gamma/tau [Atopococcus tabaci]